MSTISIDQTHLTVSFTWAERIGGLVRDLRVPLAAITNVEVLAGPVAQVRGIRAPGLAVPGVRKIGTWRSRRGRTLVSVRRGQPAVRIELTGQRIDILVIGADDARSVAERLGDSRSAG